MSGSARRDARWRGTDALEELDRQPRPSVRGGELGTPACFLRQSVRDFDVLDDRNLVIFAPDKADAYHVRVSPPSGHLRLARVLAFEPASFGIRGYAGEDLTIAEAGVCSQQLTVTGNWRSHVH